MNSYEERQEARRARYEAAAEKAAQEASAHFQKARDMADVIPLGQPIIVGHHSERHDRAYRTKIDRQYEKSFAAREKAKYYEQKAASVGKAGISSDDPDAIKKLAEKLNSLKILQDRMVAANKAIRLKDKEKGDAKLREMGYSDSKIKTLREPDFCGRIGYPAYALQNNNANIRRIEQRIKDLQSRQEREPVNVETKLYTYTIEDNRCQFIFDGKPDEEVRNILKGHSFKWSPTRGAWVRQASNDGIYAANRVREKLAALLEQQQ